MRGGFKGGWSVGAVLDRLCTPLSKLDMVQIISAHHVSGDLGMEEMEEVCGWMGVNGWGWMELNDTPQ